MFTRVYGRVLHEGRGWELTNLFTKQRAADNRVPKYVNSFAVKSSSRVDNVVHDKYTF